MAPTDDRVARPERRWGCRRGTPFSTNRLADINATKRNYTQEHHKNLNNKARKLLTHEITKV